jgi:16S rRNA processing protein RimM
VEVGRIVGAWGVKGGIKVKPHAAHGQALCAANRWFVATAGAAATQASLRITRSRAQGEHLVATAQGLTDRDAAERLAGARVFVARASFPAPAPDEYYWVDLIGLAVSNRERHELGTVIGLIETGPTCVLRVQGGDPEAPECLIPFVGAYVDEVDLPGRRLRVDWQPGD